MLRARWSSTSPGRTKRRQMLNYSDRARHDPAIRSITLVQQFAWSHSVRTASRDQAKNKDISTARSPVMPLGFIETWSESPSSSRMKQSVNSCTSTCIFSSAVKSFKPPWTAAGDLATTCRDLPAAPAGRSPNSTVRPWRPTCQFRSSRLTNRPGLQQPSAPVRREIPRAGPPLSAPQKFQLASDAPLAEHRGSRQNGAT